MQDSRPVYSIGAISRILDIPTSTIRSWEERYAVVVPERSPGGHRLYTRDQVEQLRFISAQVADGMQPGDAHRLLEERLAEDGQRLTPPSEDTKIFILLAERDPYAADLTNYFLRTEGYDTVVAFSAADAETAVLDQRPHLAIVDLLVSGGEGVSLCRKLAKDGRSRLLAISTVDSQDEALAAGADAFLQKPLDPLQLVSTVRDILGQSAYLRSR